MARKVTFSQSIRDARQKLGKSRQELADQIGVSYASIAFWETDYCKPRAAHLTALCKALKLPVRATRELVTA